MEWQSGLSELSVISWVSAIQGCPLSGVPLYIISFNVFYSSNVALAILLLKKPIGFKQNLREEDNLSTRDK